ncbi:hypothetical protein LCGC14_2670300, partial [marine sediment metagenome]
SGDADDYFTFATLTNVPTLYGTGAYLRIGDASFTAHSLNSEDDLMVTGELEVKGITYLDGALNLADNLFIAESASADADVAAFGQFWVKSQAPNEPWFTDDEGNDIFIGQGDYAGIAVDGNANPTTINIRYEWTHIQVFDADLPENISNGAHGPDNITIGATGFYEVRFEASAQPTGTNKVWEFTVFELTTTTGPIASTTPASPVVVTDVGHPFNTNDKVKITGVTTADELNDHIYTITKLTADTYSLQEDNGGDINGAGFGAGTGGTATLVNELTYVHSHRKFAAADVGAVCGGAFVSLTKDNTVELYVQNLTDTTDITMEYCSFRLMRAG